MSERIKGKIEEAKRIQAELLAKAKEGSFAHSLSAESFSEHLSELRQLANIEDDQPLFELIDFRLMSPSLNTGSVPLSLISKAAEEIRTMVGYAALKLIQGGIDKHRVPKDLYESLDLRLSGVLPGSSRLVVTANSERDLLDDGLAKGALERIFTVLDTNGQGSDFLEAVTELGPSSAKHLREFLSLIKSYDAEADFTWKYSGSKVRNWIGSRTSINKVCSSLEVTEITDQEKLFLTGKIELLSKREKIALRTPEDKLINVLYPKRMLPIVSELHLDQEVTLQCQVTETMNPLTNESSVFYELLQIKG